VIARRRFLAGAGAVLLTVPLGAEAQRARTEVLHLAQEPAPPSGFVCPGNTFWNGHGCTSGRRPPTEDQYVEIVPGKTTKQEILALFGEPDYRSTQGSGDEELIYYMHSLGPPYPMWFRHASLRNRNGMLLFLVDQRGLFVRYSVTSQPSP
jgi:hypothetical protein